jgi:hypothetical protein
MKTDHRDTEAQRKHRERMSLCLCASVVAFPYSFHSAGSH